MHHSWDQRGKCASTIDSVLRLSQITVAVLFEVKVMVSSLDRGLDFGDEGIDSPEWFQLARLAWADDDRPVRADQVARGGEAGQGCAFDVADCIEPDMMGMAVVVELYGCHERCLVRPAATAFAALHAAEHRVVGEDHAFRDMPG